MLDTGACLRERGVEDVEALKRSLESAMQAQAFA
jgi:hypothetical protein